MGRRAAALSSRNNGRGGQAGDHRDEEAAGGAGGIPHRPKWYSSFFNLLLHIPKLVFGESELNSSSFGSSSSSFRSLLLLWSIMSSPAAAAATTTTTTRTRSGLLLPFLKCVILCLLSILVLVTIFASSSSRRHWAPPYRLDQDLPSSYRRGALQMIPTDILAIGNPSLRNARGCSDDMVDYVPCYQAADASERQCTPWKECIIRPPKGYRLPWKWPACRDKVWSSNIRLAKGLPSVVVKDDVLRFPSWDNLDYTSKLEKMISRRDGANKSFDEMGIRLVLDVGCSSPLSERLFTMCISKYEEHGSPVQVALEHGLPAMIGSFSSRQLPYSASSFDMIHCKDCDVRWLDKDGIYLLEANRLLRPGGYFIWTSSTGHAGRVLKALGSKHCWNQIERDNQTVVWQKTSKRRCYATRKSVMCDNEKYAVWDEPLKSCIMEAPHWHPVHKQPPWPHRLSLSSKRISNYVNSSEVCNEDAHVWSTRVANYWSLFTPVIFSDHPKRPGDEDPSAPANVVRNVMDMNAGCGGFNAALVAARKAAWVMNVVPADAPDNTLPLIYERGLLGTMHDWCQAFPTYPRSYDLLYAQSLLSQQLKRPDACGMAAILLEMDRLLRPEGWLLLQDEAQVVEAARSLLMQIRWESRVIEVPGQGDQRLLVGQKNWRK